MTRYLSLVLAVALLTLGGCATKAQRTVPLGQSTLDQTVGAIGVAMAPMPVGDMSFPGANCLLCMAAASMANTSLTSYAHTLQSADLSAIKGEVIARLKQRGNEVVDLSEPLDVTKLPDASKSGPNIALKDFSSLGEKYKIKKLVLINIQSIGFVRNYSAYIPNGAARAQVTGNGYVVDLESNAYQWYLPVSVTKSAEGAWDEPPKFPGLTNAYYLAIETAKDRFLEPLKKKDDE